MQGVSEGESMRTESESDMDMEMQYDMATCEEEGEDDAPRHSEEEADGSDDNQQNHASTAAATPTDGTGEAVPGKTESVKEGYEGRARRGVQKAGGYDETPKRRGSRKVRGARIRYVEEDERGGGTTEQGIRMGPVSVQRVAKERGRPQEGAATPMHDPGSRMRG